MRYLLDSHVFLWYKASDSPLAPRHRETLDNAEHELFLSVASIWELSIKRSIGKLSFTGSFEPATKSSLIQVLPIGLKHAEEIERLTRHHGDPFDHMLVAQARVEGLVLVTHDEVLAQYPAPVLRV